MSHIPKLLSFLDKDANVAKLLEKTTVGDRSLLKALAHQVIEDFTRDKNTMVEWSSMVEEGKKLAKQETQSKNEPWDGAANFKSPAIIEASITFGDRAFTELLRGRDLFKIDVIGTDRDKTKKAASENVIEFMNWQINHQMRDWRATQQRLFYMAPSFGSVFKKTFFDPLEGINKAELIHYPDFVINQGASSMVNAPFTHPMDFSRDEVTERQAAGVWRKVDIYPEPTDELDSKGSEGSNEDEEVINATDNPERFLEQNCWFDLDGDNYREPYTVTVHERTQEVVRIVPRFKVKDIFVKDDTKVRALEPGEDGTKVTLVRIKPSQNITHYEYIPSTDGTFLGLGYYHLLSSLSKLINATTNQLSDSGTLSNMQGGFLARGFRKRMGELIVKMGSWVSTDISAQDLQSGIMPHQFKEPSVVLFQLNESLEAKIQQLTVSTDLKGVLAPNAPATTTLALIQEAMLPMSAIMERFILAETEEFRQLFLLNAEFTDPALYQKVLDNPDADFERDFDVENLDIMPTANAEMSSRMQRLHRAEALTSRVELITLSGGDSRPIWNAWFDAIGADDMIDEVFPSIEDMTEDQKAKIQAQQAQQQKEQQLLNIQIDHAERQIELQELDKKSMAAERASKIRLNIVEMKVKESEAILNLEKAESEEKKNQISVYTAQLTGLRDAISATESEISFDNEREKANVERLRAIPTTATAS